MYESRDKYYVQNILLWVSLICIASNSISIEFSDLDNMFCVL